MLREAATRLGLTSTAPVFGSAGRTVSDGIFSSDKKFPWMQCCCNVIHFCNTFAVAILTGAVTFMFFQLQYITMELKQDEELIHNLQDQIRNETQDQIHDLTEKVEQNHSMTLYQMAGTFTLLTCLLTMFHMAQHLRNYCEPIVQRKVVAILWMSPVYALTSFSSLVFPSADGYLAVIKDFYEAYVIYTFLSFLIAVLGRGNRSVVVDLLAHHADHLEKPMKCLSRFYHPAPDTSDKAKANAVLMECQVLAMQFVLLRPLTSIFRFVANTLEKSNHNAGGAGAGDEDQWAYFKSANFYLSMITNVSVFFAFRGLLRFYHAVRDDLLWCQPFPKFMAIKGVVFLTFWQGLLIDIMVHLQTQQQHSSGAGAADGMGSSEGDEIAFDEDDPHDKSEQIQNFLVCLEMLFFSIAHWCVFPAEEWEEGYRPKQYASPGMGLKDFASDMKYIMRASSSASATSASSTTGRHAAGGGLQQNKIPLTMDEVDEQQAAEHDVSSLHQRADLEDPNIDLVANDLVMVVDDDQDDYHQDQTLYHPGTHPHHHQDEQQSLPERDTQPANTGGTEEVETTTRTLPEIQ